MVEIVPVDSITLKRESIWKVVRGVFVAAPRGDKIHSVRIVKRLSRPPELVSAFGFFYSIVLFYTPISIGKMAVIESGTGGCKESS